MTEPIRYERRTIDSGTWWAVVSWQPVTDTSGPRAGSYSTTTSAMSRPRRRPKPKDPTP